MNLKAPRLQKENIKLQKRIKDAGGAQEHLQRDRWTVEMTENPEIWHGALLGPSGTPYDGQQYDVLISFVNVKYPEAAPKVTFSKVIPYHANVYANGNICIDILRDTESGGLWSPAYKIDDILVSLVSMLNDPNTLSPANSEAGRAYDDDKSPNKAAFARVVLERYSRQILK
jgi:ubiquitin-protein ligase